jgi:hypothetical protein
MINDEKPGFADKFIRIERPHRKELKNPYNAMKVFQSPHQDIFSHDYIKKSEVTILNEPEKNERMSREYLNTAPSYWSFFQDGVQCVLKYETIDYGLGLTLVEKIIEKHGGHITAFNVRTTTDLSRGAVTKVSFTVKIPPGNKTCRRRIELPCQKNHSKTCLSDFRGNMRRSGLPFLE